jgi:hypothetical protein
MKEILAIVGTVLAMIIGLWKHFSREKDFKRKQAEQAKKDLEDAIKDNDTSRLLDAFHRVYRK